ncbi:MAG: N-acetyltransferase family protein [Acidimicrobiia bacterium]
MSSNVVYRDAAVADGPGIARVWVAAWQAAYAGLTPAAYLDGLSAELAWPAFERSLQDNMSVLLVEVDGDIVGFTAYGASRDADAVGRCGEVIAINLAQSVWRRGLGRELMRLTLQRLEANGFREATLWVLHGNANAMAFYEALGWKRDGVEKRDDKLTGFTLHEVRYRMALNQ